MTSLRLHDIVRVIHAAPAHGRRHRSPPWARAETRFPSATLGKRARRYWQLADSDDALNPHGALSSAVRHEVVERSDERIEGQTFDWRDGP